MLAFSIPGLSLLAHGEDVIAWGGNGAGQSSVPGTHDRVMAIASGEYHNLALTIDGHVFCWGAGLSDPGVVPAWPHFGQSRTPAELAGIQVIAAGQYHSLALGADGRVHAWGRNDDSQSSAPIDLTNVVAMAAGYRHSLALTAGGGVVGWGDNTFGQISPPTVLTNVLAIAAGGSHSMALVADGRLEVWGNNAFGQTIVPDGLGQIIAIAAGRDHCLALNQDGRVFAWGRNDAGQTTVPTDLNNAIAIACGSDHSLALTASGRVVAWGGNWAGQTNVPDAEDVVALTAGNEHSLLLRGTPEDPDVPRWTGSPHLMGVVSRPFFHRILLKNGAQGLVASGLPPGVVLESQTGILSGQPEAAGEFPIRLWAANSTGFSETQLWMHVNLPVPKITNRALEQIGLGNEVDLQIRAYNEPTGFDAMGLPPELEINRATGQIHGMALEAGVFEVQLIATNTYGIGMGTVTLEVSPVVAWGDNSHGQTTVPRGLEEVVDLTAGQSHTLALLEGGRVIAWGTGGQSIVPVTLTNAMAIAAGSRHSLALTSDGRVMAWGSNEAGQSSVPDGLSNVVRIAAGARHSLALTAEGKLVAWGDNTDRQCDIPSGLGNVVDIAAGRHHSLVLTAENEVVAWGSNGQRQCDVPYWALSNVVAVAAGDFHSLALQANGLVVSWGTGSEDRSYPYSTAPGHATNVVAIAAGAEHSLALRADGVVIAWGTTSQGHRQCTPPLGFRGGALIATGANHSVALTGLPAGRIPPQWVGTRQLLGAADMPFHQRLEVLHGATVFSATDLPPGLSLDTETGVISGLPTQSGTFELELTAANDAGATTRAVTLIVNAPVPAIVAMDFRLAGLHQYFTQQIVAQNQPDWFGAQNLPPGLAIDSQTGQIQGTTTELGDYQVTLLAGNRHGTATSPLTIRVSQLIPSQESAWDAPPPGLTNVVSLAVASRLRLTLTADGRVTAWGSARPSQAPSHLTNVIAVAAGAQSMALTDDGKVTIWPSEDPVMTVPPDLTNAVAIASGETHALALTQEGQVRAWGYNFHGETSVPAGLSNVVAIAAGANHSLALTADGGVTAWGSNSQGQCDVPWWARDVVAIAADSANSLALTAEGWVVVWGGRITAPVPTAVSNIVAIAGDDYYAMALDASGEAVYWRGDRLFDTGWSNLVAIAAGSGVRYGLVASPGLVFRSQSVEPGSAVTLVAPNAEGQPAWLEWYHDGVHVHSGNTLPLPNVQASDLGTYIARARFTFGEVTRTVIELSFDPSLRFASDGLEVVAPGQLRIRLTGALGKTVELLGSPDLQQWTSLGSRINTTGMVEFLDDADIGPRYYRARTAP